MDELGQSLEIMEVFHVRICNSKLEHGLKFLGNDRLPRIGEHPGCGVWQLRRKVRFNRIPRYGITKLQIDLNW